MADQKAASGSSNGDSTNTIKPRRLIWMPQESGLGWMVWGGGPPKDDGTPPEGVHCWSTSTATIISLSIVVREWLERRQMNVPNALGAAADGAELPLPPPLPLPLFASINIVLCLLPGLRKREWWVLMRHVEKTSARCVMYIKLRLQMKYCRSCF